jgi:dipeptidyl aminopeptidase/acylaminoacyl peptidase
MNAQQCSRVGLSVFLGILCFISGHVSLSAQQKRLLQPDDLFTLKEIVEVRLSPDGQEAIFTIRETLLKEDRNVNTSWRIKTDGRSQPVRLTDSDKDYSAQWAPDGKTIAFLSTRDGAPQIWVLNLTSGKIDKMTDAPLGVSSFKWSSNSKHLAFIARELNKDSYAQSINNKEKKGVVIDKMTFSFFQLIRNQLFLDLDNPSRLWLLDLGSGKAEQISKDLNIEDFSWTRDAGSLAIAASSPQNNSRRGIYVYSLEGRSVKQILDNEKEDDGEYEATYSNPFWSPNGKSLALIYRNRKEPASANGIIAVYSLETGKLSVIKTKDELELYTPSFEWIHDDEIYIENTHRANRGLFALSVTDGSVRRLAEKPAYENNFSFSADGNRVLFVRQSLQQPPELYVSDLSFRNATKLTELNQQFGSYQLPKSERVLWKSKDGTPAEGWLLKPLNFEEGKAYPLLVMVHGGPTFVVADRFEPYASDRGGWIWPYPFRLFASRGYAVFFPNYRGTGSYGRSFRKYSDEIKEPSDDVISGISFLVEKGIADPKLIGIMGQSHGALLGPSVMAHHRVFKASSFAEGLGNFITAYAYVHGRHNLSTGETLSGGHPYDNPQRYIERSSIFHFKGLDTATLLEFGEQSTALMGLEMLSSLWRQGVPHEMIIYPKTGHNLTSPVLQLESINRNLDWFDYWMLGKRDPSQAKQEQYARWEKVTEAMKQMRLRDASSPDRSRVR